MEKPKPKYEIHVLVISEHLNITVESPDMAQRVEEETSDFGTLDSIQGIVQEMRQAPAGLIPVTVENGSYSVTIRPTFDYLAVAKYLGRGGIVEVFMPDADEEKYYYPEAQQD